MAFNQLLSDWKNKKMDWKEESSAKVKIMNKAEEVFTDISENIEKFTGSNLSKDQGTSIELREFEMKAFKLTKA